MRLPHPSSFDPALTDAILGFFARNILEVYDSTLATLQTQDDNNYVRGTATFGRTHQRFLNLILNHQCPTPVTLLDRSLKLTFQIGESECRFFEDDYLHPRKSGFFKRSANYELFSIDSDFPAYWSFVIVRSETLDDEIRIVFVGYNLYHQPVSFWEYDAADGSLSLATPITPAPVDIGSAPIGDLDEDQQDDHVNESNRG